MLPAALLAHPTHQLHFASFFDRNVELPLVLCTRCGAHGTSKVANLAAPCPAAATREACSRSAPFRRQAAAVAKQVHPSRRGVPLHDLRSVPPGLRAVAWASRCSMVPAAAAAPVVPQPAAPAPAEAAVADAPAACGAGAAFDADAAAPGEREAGTGLPMEELLALEALAAQAAVPLHDPGPSSEDELGFGGFDD